MEVDAKDYSMLMNATEHQKYNSDMQELGAFRANKEKNGIEFNRYKQDCRKRALELAHSEFQSMCARVNSMAQLNNKSFDMNTSLEAIQPLADKYYNWLISIPND